ncbi:hypothetical protein Ctob_006660 [Chrysochromulina tobinii]|uniref:Uncharacterized protein n=1 Tax=Chrysochromulina tobinii TaxID=1460289 RepID=A0A0M0JQH5_9EUKA|nr:hypothetical protein Ctob_006660 [Chrysochromulina tobinii]|eukprot:KOO28735.1 hypothetical protein Ctob_006660 [Chrysochromulina sp. CCMP291]
MRVSTASPITRSIAIDHTIARLETLSQRQNVQLEKEHKGKRRQGKPPWPQGSRPARRIQEKINARRAAAQAIVDRIEAERLEHEAELEAERQILEQEKMLAEMEAWEKWESNGGGDSPPGSSRRWDAARNWMRKERVVQVHLQLDEECYVRLSVTASTLTPRRAARLHAAAERRTLAKLAEEEAERQRLAKEAEDARRYAALGTTRWVRADSDFNAVLIFAFLGSRGLSLDQGGWPLAQLLGQLSWQWRRTCLRWCEDVETLKLRAGLDWGACRWTSGVMAAIERTVPRLTHLELHGLDRKAFSGLELISSSLTILTLSGCTDVGPMLEATHFPRVHTLRIERCRDLTAEACRQIAKEWRLRSLRMEGSTVTRSLIISFSRALPSNAPLESIECTEPFPDDAIKAIAKTCPALCSIVLPISGPYAIREAARCFPRLQRLRLGLQAELPSVTKRTPCWTDTELQALAQGCPELSELHLADGRNGFTAMSGVGLATLPRLTDLSLANLPSPLAGDAMIESANALSELVHLNLSDCSIPDAGANSRMPSLIYVGSGSDDAMPGMADRVLAAFLRACSKLETLNVAGISQLTNSAVFKAVPIACTKLRHVDVGPGRKGGHEGRGLIDGKGLVPLVDACPQLRSLRLSSAMGTAARASADLITHAEREKAKRLAQEAMENLQDRLERAAWILLTLVE